MVKNPPSNVGDTGLIPGWGTKIPHACTPQLLSPQAPEPTCHNYRAHAPQLESPSTTTTEAVSSGARVPHLEKPVGHN